MVCDVGACGRIGVDSCELPIVVSDDVRYSRSGIRFSPVCCNAPGSMLSTVSRVVWYRYEFCTSAMSRPVWLPYWTKFLKSVSDRINPVEKISLAMTVAYGEGVFASARIISGDVAWKTISLPSVPHASMLMTALTVSLSGCWVMKTVGAGRTARQPGSSLRGLLQGSRPTLLQRSAP